MATNRRLRLFSDTGLDGRRVLDLPRSIFQDPGEALSSEDVCSRSLDRLLLRRPSPARLLERLWDEFARSSSAWDMCRVEDSFLKRV